MNLESIHVSNCPVCNAFPVQHIASGDDCTAYRFLAPRNTRAVEEAFAEGQRLGADLLLEAEAPRLEWSPNLCDGKRVDYATAEKACAALGEGWRLPTRPELESIIDLSRHSPAAGPERFPDMKNDWYWSSTPCAWSSALAWCVGFYYGLVLNFHRDDSLAFVRAVRAVPAGQ